MTPDAGLVSGHTGSPHWLTSSTHLYVQSLFVPPHTPSLNIPYVWHCPTYPVRISQICMFLLFLSSWWLQSLGWPFPNLYLQFLNSPSITDKRLLVFGIVSVIPCLPGLCLCVLIHCFPLYVLSPFVLTTSLIRSASGSRYSHLPNTITIYFLILFS